MTVKDIIEAIMADKYPIIALILIMMTVVQISPLHINPWDTIFGWFGKKINKDIIAEMDGIKETLNNHIKDSEENELRVRRTNILDFSSSIIRGVNYHKEKFDFMISECDSYEEYCKKNNIKNGVAEASIAEIRRVYQEHLRNDDFLVDNATKK